VFCGGKDSRQKARVKPGAAIDVINRVPGVVESLGLPKAVVFVEPAKQAEFPWDLV
jgi:hypothetical protein